MPKSLYGQRPLFAIPGNAILAPQFSTRADKRRSAPPVNVRTSARQTESVLPLITRLGL